MSVDIVVGDGQGENPKHFGEDDLHGLLAAYTDDQLDESVNSALKRKSRVRYKCFDTFSNFLAFGTSGGAVYLFKLTSVTHSSCTLVSMVPCDQGSIEVIKFLPNAENDDLLIVIGTNRGSLVVFRPTRLPGDQNPIFDEIYRAETFTNGQAIKIIEYDQDLFDPMYSFSRLYICDATNRLYMLETNNIYQSRQKLFSFYSHPVPEEVRDLNGVIDSNINQISYHRSQLLISTDKTTKLFNDYSRQLYIIGKKKRKEGFYGACFFNPNYKPTQVLQMKPSRTNSQLTYKSSTNSLAETESLLMFVARPMFRLWQVNNQANVMFTHQFESLIKSNYRQELVKLHNEPLKDGAQDFYSEVVPNKKLNNGTVESQIGAKQLRSDHFHRLVPIHSPRLGNLLLSYTRNEIFILDPIGAKLVVSYSQDDTIVQVCCNENELFVWSLVTCEPPNSGNQQTLRLRRLVLLTPFQFVLELHRVHRYATLIVFVQMFADLFRQLMALPLSSSNVITIEGGLLRNVLLNAWDVYESRGLDNDQYDEAESSLIDFEKIINEIIVESTELRNSIDNLADSRFLLNMSMENLQRLNCKPYNSLVSLEISLADLHTNHVVHFNKEAPNRHKSVADLSRGIGSLDRAKQTTRSNFDVRLRQDPPSTDIQPPPAGNRVADTKVIVERQRLRRPRINQTKVEQPDNKTGNLSLFDRTYHTSLAEEEEQNQTGELPDATNADDERQADSIEACESIETQSTDKQANKTQTDDCSSIEEMIERQYLVKCRNCEWPFPRSHLNPPAASQRIQSKWIEENLLENFETNIEQIEELAFRHALWPLYLRCLAFKGRIDDYITCCMMLDDLRLLNIEHLIITHCGEDELLSKLLAHLSRKVDLLGDLSRCDAGATGDGHNETGRCLRCSTDLDKQEADEACELKDDLKLRSETEHSFNLMNLIELFMMRPNADMKRLISRLLKYPKLLNNSEIPVNFYLKTIATATLVANQSPLSRAKLSQLQSSTRFRA